MDKGNKMHDTHHVETLESDLFYIPEEYELLNLNKFSISTATGTIWENYQERDEIVQQGVFGKILNLLNKLKRRNVTVRA